MQYMWGEMCQKLLLVSRFIPVSDCLKEIFLGSLYMLNTPSATKNPMNSTRTLNFKNLYVADL